MRAIRIAIVASFSATLGFAPIIFAQTGVSSAPHTIVVKLIEQAGPVPYGFEPSIFTAEPGDTIKFVQAASVLHNVHFKMTPKGARLGSAAVSQYLTSKGQSTSLVIDSRFVEGRYEIVCDPHEMIGMHAFLTVEGRAPANGGTK
ncbi:MAG TPA: plastocyanin/azurin family copper-binding protein [Gemmatimonadaceae bacterium]|jgi:plastocyanin